MRRGTRLAWTAACAVVGTVSTTVSLAHTAKRRRGEVFWRNLSTDLRCAAKFHEGRVIALAHTGVNAKPSDLADTLIAPIPGFLVTTGGYNCDVDFETLGDTACNKIQTTITGDLETLQMVAERLRTDSRGLNVRDIVHPVNAGENGYRLTFAIVVLPDNDRDVLALIDKLRA